MAACSASKECKAWTYNPTNKQCGLKKQAKFIYQKGFVSGPVEGNVVEMTRPDCSQKSLDENKYKCDSTILDKYNLGEASFKTTWSECRSACNGDPECKAYTYTATGMCQKKKLNEYMTLAPNSGNIAGPRSGPAAADVVPSTSTTTTTTTPTTSPPAAETPTPKPDTNFLTAKSPFGIEWWIVMLVLFVVVGASSSMMMVMVMASSSE
jgi:hypothetical protein